MAYINMQETTEEDYKEYCEKHKNVVIEEVKLEICKRWELRGYQPKEFKPETTTVWSFPKRGDWATHYLNIRYRGNWAPEIPRNLILKYSKPKEMVLDAFVGGGTTLIECKLLGRNGIGVDINPDAIMITRDRLNFEYRTLNPDFPKTIQKTYVGDARNLNLIEDNSIDLIATHPPYANIIPYSQKIKAAEGDLSKVISINEFIKEMKKVGEELFRVLKPGRYCAMLMGDTRRHKHFVPIAYRTMQTLLSAGFILKEDIIKLQHRMFGSVLWRGKVNDFYLIFHEHLFVFRKPEKGESIRKYSESARWW